MSQNPVVVHTFS